MIALRYRCRYIAATYRAFMIIKLLLLLQSSVRSEGSGDDEPNLSRRRPSILPSNVMQSVIGVKFIADHMKQQSDENKVWILVLAHFLSVFIFPFRSTTTISDFTLDRSVRTPIFRSWSEGV